MLIVTSGLFQEVFLFINSRFFWFQQHQKKSSPLSCAIHIKLSACEAVIDCLTLHASFPPSLYPAQIIFSVMFPLKESVALHTVLDTMGSLTVRRVAGIPPVGVVKPQPDTVHTRPTATIASCRGNGARDTKLFT